MHTFNNNPYLTKSKSKTMKKTLLLLSVIALPVMMSAQVSEPPTNVKWEPGVYALQISPNGQWILSSAGDMSIYETATGKNVYYDGMQVTTGTGIANNGTAVGYESGQYGKMVVNGKLIEPEALSGYEFCPISGISADATRVAGMVTNPKGGETLWVPFVADLDAQGNMGEITILPYPEKDFLGGIPTYSTADCLTYDGKVILGNYYDWTGKYIVPIVYFEGEDGTWSYVCPSEPLFNPEGIELPANPYWNEPYLPEPEEFMTGLYKTQYLQAYEEWMAGLGDEPDPKEYMSEENWEIYKGYLENWEVWYESEGVKLADYEKVFTEVLKTSPSFELNDFAMHPYGEFIMVKGGMLDASGERMERIYKFNLNTSDYEVIEAPSPAYFPCQILPDGTTLLTMSQDQDPNTLMYLPDQNKFMTITEFLGDAYPEVASWLKDNFPFNLGHVSMSEDYSVIAGGLLPDDLIDYDYETADFYYSSYIITNLDLSGVEAIEVAPEDGLYRVYNLQGVKVLETKEKSAVTQLPTGIYVVNGKKVMLQ